MLRRVRERWPFDVLDLLALVGLVALGVGLAGYDQRIALIVVGTIVMAYAFVAALPPRGAA